MDDNPPPEFQSPDELGRLLGLIANRLHHINRVSGESNFTWHLAETIKAAGALAALMSDKETATLFGDGYTPGTIAPDQQTDLILALLHEKMPR